MDEKVRLYLNYQRENVKKQNQLKKEQLLTELGLVEKVYSPNGIYTAEYPLYEIDQNGSYRYYKKVPCSVSDEEFEEIKRYLNAEKEAAQDISPSSDSAPTGSGYNPVSILLLITAVILYIAGFVLGLKNGMVDNFWSDETEFVYQIALLYWIGGFALGTAFLSFSEIIRLLNAIKNK